MPHTHLPVRLTSRSGQARRHVLPLLLALLALALPIAPIRAQDAPDDTFIDLAARYSVPVPTNWTATTAPTPDGDDVYLTLSAPETSFTTYIVVLAGDSAAEAVDAAWAIVRPDFAFEPNDTQLPPSAPGVDETVVVTQINADQTVIDQGYAQRVGDQVYVLLFSGPVAVAVQRNAQIQIIASGFTILGLDQIDLSSAMPRPLDAALLAEFEAAIRADFERLKIPGAAVAVVQDGAIIYEAGFGVRALDGAAPVTPGTQMMIGSTTKPMTTTLMAALIDDGLLTWDTPMIELLPGFAVADPEITQTITLRNMVCACTGVPRRDLELIFNAGALSADDVVASLADFTFFTDFGEAFQYSNQMVAAGGYAAAASVGDDDAGLYDAYVDAMAARVFGPLGMNETTLSIEAVLASDDVALPHGSSLDAGYVPLPVEIEAILTPVAPAGAIWSTASDMARFMLMQLGRGVAPGGERVVSAENLEITWEPQIQADAQQVYGLGWFIEDYKGVRIIHHGGNTFGFTSGFAFLPDHDLGVVVLVNAQGANLFTEAVRERLLQIAFDFEDASLEETLAFALEQGEQSQAELAESLLDELDESALAPFLGTFINPILGELTLALDDAGVLTADAVEFVVTLRAATDPDTGEVNYIAMTPPLAGLGLELTLDDTGAPSITLDIVTDQYVFTLTE